MKKTRILCVLMALTTLAFTACNPLALLTTDSQTSQTESQQKEDILLSPPTLSAGFINSLDKLNYYAARKTVDDYLATKAVKTTDWGVWYSGEAAVDSVYDEDIPDSGYGEDTSEKEENGYEPPDSIDTNRPQDTDTKVYYDLYSWHSFTMKRTIYFQIELSDENAFLGKNLGTGIVEVAITMGDIHDDLNMITFRNGDKFFSCMYHGYMGINEETQADKYAFAAYRYIEGFYYVKDLQYKHLEFHIEVGAIGDAVFTCNYQHSVYKNEPVTVVENSTYCIDKEVTYTLEELEEYFNPSIQTDSASELPV